MYLINVDDKDVQFYVVLENGDFLDLIIKYEEDGSLILISGKNHYMAKPPNYICGLL